MMVNSVSHPCGAIDVLVDVADGLFINRLPVVEVWSIDARDNVIIDLLTDVVTNTRGVALEFVVTSLSDVDALWDVRAGVAIESVTDIGFDLLVGVMSALNFVLRSLLEEWAL